MSLNHTKSEIAKLLRSSDPHIICLKGKWGIGKTFLWKSVIDNFLGSPQATPFSKYSYASLFGINSIEELKYLIFESSVPINKPRSDILGKIYYDLGSNFREAKKFLRLSEAFTPAQKLHAAAKPFFFSTIRNYIICIDDVERMSSRLQVKEVLGLISYLKEEKGCKVVFLINEEQLDKDGKNDLATYFEKVVDRFVVLNPTTAEAAQIGLTTSDPLYQMTLNFMHRLNIKNIRTIKKIQAAIDEVRNILDGNLETILDHAIPSIILFVWAHNHRSEAPPLEFIRSFLPDNRGELATEEVDWTAQLQNYGYHSSDELDICLIDGIQSGFFDSDQIRHYATSASQSLDRQRLRGDFQTAWSLYHDSFENNEDLFLQKLGDAFQSGIGIMTPNELNSTIKVFKDLGRSDEARKLLRAFLSVHRTEENFYNLELQFFGSDVDDPDIRSAFENKRSLILEKRTKDEIFLDLKGKFESDDVSLVAKESEEEYLRMIKTYKGNDLRILLSGLLQYRSMKNPTSEMNEITQKTIIALKQIGQESPINRLRVAKYGGFTDDGSNLKA